MLHCPEEPTPKEHRLIVEYASESLPEDVCFNLAGVDPQVFVDVLGKGGWAGMALERLRKCILTGDASDVPFAIGNAIKDIDYYREMVGDGQGSRAIADGVSSAIGTAAKAGHGDAYVPELTRLFRG